MHLARAIHFDESDQNVFASPARTGEWCISGGFEFSNWGEADLTGKQRQAFANGWMGLPPSRTPCQLFLAFRRNGPRGTGHRSPRSFCAHSRLATPGHSVRQEPQGHGTLPLV